MTTFQPNNLSNNISTLWFHDAADQDHDDIDLRFKYGVCIDCGVGLDDANSFFYDRREKQCDCYTCDHCFEHFFGKDALFEAENWFSLGKPIPQYVRISCFTY
jgi:hypothetical protein